MPDIKKKVATSTIKKLNKDVKKADRSVNKVKDDIKDSKQVIQQSDAHTPEKAPEYVIESAEKAAVYKTGNFIANSPSTSVKAYKNSKTALIKTKQNFREIKKSGEAVKNAVKNTKTVAGKGMRSIQNSIKTANNMIKTANSSVRTANAVYKGGVKTLKVAVQEAKVFVKASAEVVKVAVHGTVAAVKGIISAIMAGGWIALLIIAVLIIIILVTSSVLGIFFSWTDGNESGLSMPVVIETINDEYQKKIDDIRNSSPNATVELTGSRAVWSDVLSVYAVSVNYDKDNPQDIMSMDETKKEKITEIFWSMNEISSKTETKTVDVVTETSDEYGNIIQTITQEQKTFIYITVAHKTAQEMAKMLNFTQEQLSALDLLLSPENAEMWTSVIYGTLGNNNIVDIAKTQVGNIGGEPYWKWYGFANKVEWCACFVSWCANECGYLENGIVPKYASCTAGSNWFKSHNLWQDRTYTPTAGDIVFFNWSDNNGVRDELPDHTGIVEKVDDNYIYTIEGNAGDMVVMKKYPLQSNDIFGYGVPAY